MAGEQIKIPGIGEVKSEYVWGAGAVIGGIWLYVWWRGRSGAGATATADSAPVDLGAQGDASTPFVNPNPAGSAGGTVNDAGTIATDASWTQACVDALQAIGYDPQFVGSTLGAYLASQNLTQDQASLVRTAWGIEGRPPEHPNLPILTSTSPSSGGTPAGGGSASVTSAPSGFVIAAETANSTTVRFTTVPNAVFYEVFLGSIIVATGTSSPITITGLGANTSHTFTMDGVSAAGKRGPRSGSFTGHTKAK